MSVSVIKQTTTNKLGVLYTIHVGGKEKWRKFVQFGRGTRVAGGPAFREAANAQDVQAGKLLAEAACKL